MRIKRLEIVGFKSFCDRMVLNFDQPVTGVVGPNGCGKSNIVDAIRWCMGEQSAKHLRGKAMDDIIFAGSDSRGKSGMCEVSMTFENDGRVPVDYLAYSEITVTRRLYRDGTSEYLLNKTPCRLRDVTEFFLGTGVGARAYSIIEQGRIGMIVSSKPEDRRLLIEEAAGITKFKLKKKAAEKKMDSTRQNLLRVSDVIAELEKQLGSLRRQAQKAERYKQYKTEMKDIELWSASQRWLGLRAEEGAFEERILSSQARKEEAQRAVVVREAEIEAARLGAAEEGRRIEGLQEKLYELNNRIRLAEAQAEHESRQAGGLEERANAAKEEVEQLGHQIAHAEEELARLRAEAQTVDEGTAGQSERLAGSDEEVRRLKDRLAEAQRLLEGAKAEIGRAQADIARNESVERSLMRRLEDLEMRLARIVDEEGRLRGRESELSVEIGDLQQGLDELRAARLAMKAESAGLEERFSSVRTEIAGQERDLEVLTLEMHRKKSRHSSLLEIQQRYEGFQRGTQAIMKQPQDRWGVRGLVADVVQAPPEYEIAVEAALGERLGSIVVESHEAGLDGIEYLKTKREGRTSFVPLRARASEAPQLPPSLDASFDASVDASLDDKPGEGGELPSGVRGRMIDLVSCDEEHRAVAAALLGDVYVVEDLLTAVDLWRAGTTGRLVTLDGDVLDFQGVVAGGSRDAQGAGVLQQKREVRELDEAVASVTRRHAEASEKLAALRTLRQEIQTRLETLRRDGHQSEMGILTSEKDLARLTDELGRLGVRAKTIGGERQDLSGQRDDAVFEGEEARLGLRKARALLAAAEDRRDECGRLTVGLFDELEAATARLTEIKVQTAQVEEKRRAVVRALMQTDTQKSDQEARRARLQRQISDGVEESTALRGMADARRRELLELSGLSKEEAQVFGESRAAYDQRRNLLLVAEGELKTVRSALEKVAGEVGTLELQLREARMNRNHLEEQVADRYRLALEEQLDAYKDRPPIGETEDKRLRELRDLIDRMGEINLTAIEEYQALEGRYTFLLTQKGDLEKALAQLEEAIAQINRTSKKRFREVFDLVNERFQELFPRLFRGGHAYLALTNPDDVLESGIEIFAQPPGKKNATVELLSGGEKALTAVSMIFAIFLIKPSPFCLLDEVDAPLDEANVGRFNELVRTMTDRSQFIVITHNKRTMEIADTLYGVTMEEPGISKLVSVNLSTAGTRKAA